MRNKNLIDFIESINTYLENFKYKSIHLNVVFYNDGSSDNSLNILENSGHTILSELNNNGLGYVIDRLLNTQKILM